MSDVRETTIGGLEKKFRGGGLFDPNRISFYGLVLGVAAGVSTFFDETRWFAPIIYGGSLYCDYKDGNRARELEIPTKEGAILDPLVDKLKNVAIGGLMIYNEYVANPVATMTSKAAIGISNVANFVVDYSSQKNRGPWGEQFYKCVRAIWNPRSCERDGDEHSKLRATRQGKYKAGIQGTCHLAYLTYLGYSEVINEAVGRNIQGGLVLGIASALSVSAVLGHMGLKKRENIVSRAQMI